MTRSKVYKGLQTGAMTRQSIYRNERENLTHKDMCSYCGATGIPLTLDHLFAKSKTGSDSGDNLVYCCQSCNSSKRNKDYFEWIKTAGRPVSIPVAERYLKNAYSYCQQNNLLDSTLDLAPSALPFSLQAIPLKFDIAHS